MPRPPDLIPHDRSQPDAGESRGSKEVAAMAAAWDRGERVTASEILDHHPEIDGEDAIRLIYEEVCLRRDAGLEVRTTEVVKRHPRWGEELRSLFDCDRLLRPSGAPVAFPEIGETIGSFRLLAELGRGASGRTFLATDPTLADRPVVLKIIPDDQEEHLALARLRHTHIVPLFSEHAIPERGLRLLCMPYLGGVSLGQVLADLAGTPSGEASGKRLVDVIDRNTRASPAPPPSDGPFRRRLEAATYSEAITWIISCLADALHYAHARGLVHMDVKPSNVLITVDGQPMLLDFHLSRPPIQAQAWVADRLGGTPGWMSPEQQAAMEAVGRGEAVPVGVDGRTDVYALGLMLREALAAPARPRSTGIGKGNGHDAGQGPARKPPAPVVVSVSVGLEDVIRKCLRETPEDRYEDAATLADDLRRHLNDQPLRGVDNRSLGERWAKWRRRRPGDLAWAVACLSILVGGGIALGVSSSAYRQRLAQIENALKDSEADRLAGRFDEALHILSRGEETARSLPGSSVLFARLEQQIRLAKLSRAAEELHKQADLIRFRFGVNLPSPQDSQALAAYCRAIWQRRLDLLAIDPRHHPESAERIKTDLIEIVTVWTDLQMQRGSTTDAETANANAKANAEALIVLNEAKTTFGENFAIESRLDRLKASAATPGNPGAARRPRTPWEHYDLGRTLLREARFEDALGEFRRVLDGRPQDFWPNFYQGLCAYRLRRFDEASAAFRVCVALAPKAAPCYYNRALVDEAIGRLDDAERSYSRAIELDPKLVQAWMNRGILAHKAKQYARAISDYRQALDADPDRDTLGRLHYNLALAQTAQGDRASALTNAEAAWKLGYPEAKALRDRLR